MNRASNHYVRPLWGIFHLQVVICVQLKRSCAQGVGLEVWTMVKGRKLGLRTYKKLLVLKGYDVGASYLQKYYKFY
jgi:hypothetical protein